MGLKCKHGNAAWDSVYQCLACEEDWKRRDKDSEWNAAIEKAVAAIHSSVDSRNITFVQAVALLDDVRALKREVKP